MPIEWHELERALYPEDFPLTDVRARLDAVGNPWRAFFQEPQSIAPMLGPSRRGAQAGRWCRPCASGRLLIPG